jgi:hypothetical protein
MENTDTQPGGEALSIEEAAKAYAATQTTEPEGQPDPDEEAEVTTDDELQEPVEGEGEEADGETDEEGQAEGETDEEPETERGRYVAHDGRVKLPDGSESTIADLIQGNLRDRDYRQKTMSHADEVKAFQASKQQLEEQRGYMASLIQSIVPPEPDPALIQTAPMDYMAQQAQRKQWLEHLQYLDEQNNLTAKERQENAAKEEGEKRDREWNALLGQMPELKDDKSVVRFANEVKQYGTSYGFTPEELARLPLDHRQAVVLAKAIKWDKLQASKPQAQKKVENRPPVTKGGKRLNPSEHRARSATDAMKRAQAEPSVENVTAAYLASLNKG